MISVGEALALTRGREDTDARIIRDLAIELGVVRENLRRTQEELAGHRRAKLVSVFKDGQPT